GGSPKSQVVDANGATTFKDVGGPGKVTRVTRDGPHTTSLVWVTDQKEGQPGSTIEVPLKTRLRLSTWARTRELFYASASNPKLDWGRCESIFDAMKGKVDDVLILQTFTMSEKEPKPTLVRAGDFYMDFAKFDDIAHKLTDTAHARGIQIQAGFAVVD